jgi:hypothetical protein
MWKRYNATVRCGWIIVGLMLIACPIAQAGMPTMVLTDLARMRVQTISFFLLVFLASAWGMQRVWNFLRRDFARLPRLSYGRSLAFVSLWGLLFLLVLTMISGARELLTPGAWERQGATYRLTQVEPQPVAISHSERHSRLTALKAALWEYAQNHDGALPVDERSSGIAAAMWETPEPSRIHYIYIPGAKAGAGDVPVAYEPPALPRPQLMLRSDGEIREADARDIQRARSQRVAAK